MEITPSDLGRLIAKGGRREVYEHKNNPDLVIKKLIPGRETIHNETEYEAWQIIKEDEELRKWVAPIIGISKCKEFLIMKRGTKLKTGLEVPNRQIIPKPLRSDLKQDNWVNINGRPVLCDYDCKQLDKLRKLQENGR